MNYIVCSIYNKDTREYSAPVLYKTSKIAIADFSVKMDSLKGKRYFDRSDYSLFWIGKFDSDTGCIVPCVTIVKLADGVAVDISQYEDDDDDDDDDDGEGE